MSIIKRIQKFYKSSKSLLFTTPSHSLGNFIIPSLKNILGEKYFKSDFSEIEGFDILRNPEGAIKDLQENIAKIYNAESSFILTNGSTSGVIAAMLATLKPNDKVLIARNCHISVYNGLVLTGANPIWFMPEFDKEWGIFKGITPENIKKNINKDIKVLIITSPTYEGIFSDIKEISKICKENNVLLIVDEAHGALLNFSNYKSKSAIQCGADIAIQSLHKTTGAPNPCALMHMSKNISHTKVQEALNLVNTTSPSYPLIAAIEGTVTYLNSVKGKNHIKKLFSDIEKFKQSLDKSIQVYSANNDKTKILLKFNNINALKAAEILNESYKIEEEFTNNHALLFITGIGTDAKKLKTLSKALNKIAKLKQVAIECKEQKYELPKAKYTPRTAYFMQTTNKPKDQTIGLVSAEAIVPYPPGIPLILPGEIIDEQVLSYIDKKEIKVIL